MHPADIKASLEKAGSSQADVCRTVRGRNGGEVTAAAVHHVIRGLSKSKFIAQKISDITGIPVSKLWPGKYPELEKVRGRKSSKGRK